MEVNQQGNVYLTGPPGIWIFDPDARHLGVIQVPEGVASLVVWRELPNTIYL